jgi:hypothetical protein
MVDGCLKDGLKTGGITQMEYLEWWKELDDENKAGDFFAVFSGFIVKGTKTEIQPKLGVVRLT